MEELASMRYKIINPMIKTLIDQERKFFGTCFNLINKFYNNMDSLQQPVPYNRSNYDAMKYTRAGKIMEGVDTKSLPEIKMKAKYSYDDYKNRVQRANSLVNNNISTNISSNFGNNDNITKKFTFQDYQKRKESIDKNINNNNITNSSNINNKVEDKSNNPYSYEAYRKRTLSLGNKRPQINNNINNNNNNNNNYYNNNLNLVMNIIGEDKTKANNPFSDLGNNHYTSSSNNNNNPYNPYSVNNNNDLSNNNPYNNIFNSSNNNNSNNMFNQQNNNDNSKFRRSNDKYNFGL